MAELRLIQVEEETDIKEEKSFDAASADREEAFSLETANKQTNTKSTEMSTHSADEIQLCGYRKHLLLSFKS